MSDNIVNFPGITTLPLDPARVLAGAAKERFQRVIVIGVTEDGDEYYSCSDPDGGTFLWDVERAKLRLLRQAD